MAIVEVKFSPLAAHVRTARLVASAIARRSGVQEELLDEVRFAVGEACARAVDLHRRFAPETPVTMVLADVPGRFEITVVDAAPPGEDVVDPTTDGIGGGVFDPDAFASAVPRQPDGEGDPTEATLDFLPAGFGLAVIHGLVDDVDVLPATNAVGTRVRMSWTVPVRTS